MILDHLNTNQKKAVRETEGPVMVIAGAGTGKTRVLSNRIAYLIENGLSSSSHILAVTFTNKAAKEMKERVKKLLKNNINVDGMWVSTFHSFCNRFLRKEIDVLKTYKRNFVIIDEDDAASIIKNIIKNKYEKQLSFTPKQICSLISKKKNIKGFVFPCIELDLIQEEFEEHLLKENLLTFDDLIILTLRILKDHKEVLKRYQEFFKYILVDEFQDTNYLQYELIYLLSKKRKNIFVVGDEDQSIYSFRGAVVENIAAFKKDFKPVVVVLDQNYRSSDVILKYANELISHNTNRNKKNLFSEIKTGFLPRIEHFYSGKREQNFIIRKIKTLVLDGYSYSDIVILYRNNYLSRGYEESLMKARIPYVVYGGLSYFQRKEVKDILAYLALALNNDINIHFERIVNVPPRKNGNKTIYKLKDICEKINCSLFEAINHTTDVGLKEFKEIINDIRNEINKTDNLKNIIDYVCNRINYFEYLESFDKYENEYRVENVKELKSIIHEYSVFNNLENADRINNMLNDVSLYTSLDKEESDNNKVKVMTLHQVKGLEFKVVFLVGLEQGIFPNDIIDDSESNLEEERRICYVGITRAMERLYLTHSDSRFLFGQVQYYKSSIFIDELEEINQEHIKLSKNDKSSKDVVVNNKLKTGVKVIHPTYEEGVVVGESSSHISIAFNVGIKFVLIGSDEYESIKLK